MEYDSSNNTKNSFFNVAIVGDFNSGKSSFIKKLVADYDKDQQEEGNRKYYYKENSRNHYLLKTSKYYLHLTDKIHHNSNYLKNTINEISYADCIILIISAKKNEFNKSISSSGQIINIIKIICSLSPINLIIAINKMDQTIPAYDPIYFEYIQNKLIYILSYTDTIKTLSSIAFIPISSLDDNNNNDGGNIIYPCNYTPWFKGWVTITSNELNNNGIQINSGATIMQAIDHLNNIASLTSSSSFLNNIHKPTRFILQKINWKRNKFFFTGHLVSGSLMKGKDVFFPLVEKNCPSHTINIIQGQIDSLKMYNNSVDIAIPNSIIEFTLDNLQTTTSSSLLSHDQFNASYYRQSLFMISDNINDKILKPVIRFEASVVFYKLVSKTVKIGYIPMISSHFAHVPCKIISIIEKMNIKAECIENVMVKNPLHVYSNEIACIVFEPLKPISLESNKNNVPNFLINIILYDSNKIIGFGVIRNIIKQM